MTRTPPTKKLKPRTLAQIYLDLARVEDLDDLLLAAASIKDHDPKWAAALVAEAAPVIPSTTDTLMLLNVAGALAGDPKHHAAATALMQQVSSRHLRKYERPEVASTWALVDMA